MDRQTVRKMIARAIRWTQVTGPGKNNTPKQVQQISHVGIKQAKSATALPYGLEAWAPAGTQAVFWSLNGDPDNRTHMPVSRGDRVKAEAIGEVVLHHPATGNKVHFRSDGSLDIEATGDVNITSATNVNVTAPSVALTGDTTVTGDLAVTGATNPQGALNHDGTTIGFYSATPVTIPTVTGVRNSFALASLLTELETMGLIVDGST